MKKQEVGQMKILIRLRFMLNLILILNPDNILI